MKAKKSAKHAKLQFCLNIAIVAMILLILVSLIGIPQPVKKQQNIENQRQVLSSIATNSMFVFPPATPSGNIFTLTPEPPTPTITPTPTPNLHFRHSKWFFSFDIPKEATVYETIPEEPKLVENSIGGAYVEIPNKFYVEFAVVQPFGQNLDQYYHNRMSMIFNEKILETKTATFSGTLKGYEARLQDTETKEKKIILYLPLRGTQFFEIEAVFPQKKHDKEEKMFFQMVATLKNY